MTEKVLRRIHYNNGYGCSCCGRNWEKATWINRSEMLSLDALVQLAKYSAEHLADDPVIAGVIYESNGKIEYGYKMNIYTALAYIIFYGDNDLPKQRYLDANDWADGIERDDELLKLALGNI